MAYLNIFLVTAEVRKIQHSSWNILMCWNLILGQRVLCENNGVNRFKTTAISSSFRSALPTALVQGLHCHQPYRVFAGTFQTPHEPSSPLSSVCSTAKRTKHVKGSDLEGLPVSTYVSAGPTSSWSISSSSALPISFFLGCRLFVTSEIFTDSSLSWRVRSLMSRSIVWGKDNSNIWRFVTFHEDSFGFCLPAVDRFSAGLDLPVSHGFVFSPPGSSLPHFCGDTTLVQSYCFISPLFPLFSLFFTTEWFLQNHSWAEPMLTFKGCELISFWFWSSSGSCFWVQFKLLPTWF